MTATLSVPPPPASPRPYHFPAFERRALRNGLHLWLVPLPDRELVNVHLVIDAPGDVHDGAGDEAVAGARARFASGARYSSARCGR